jgi:hypothetical protein
MPHPPIDLPYHNAACTVTAIPMPCDSCLLFHLFAFFFPFSKWQENKNVFTSKTLRHSFRTSENISYRYYAHNSQQSLEFRFRNSIYSSSSLTVLRDYSMFSSPLEISDWNSECRINLAIEFLRLFCFSVSTLNYLIFVITTPWHKYNPNLESQDKVNGLTLVLCIIHSMRHSRHEERD